MRHFILVLAMLTVATGARAAGIDLSWNDCLAGSLTASTNRNFTCLGATNQTYNLMFQFRTPVAINAFVALTAYADLGVQAPGPLAPFWHYETGGCNRTPISGVGVSIENPLSCREHHYVDPWGDGSNVFAALAAYGADFGAPGRGRFIFLVARGDAVRVEAGVNYFGFQANFNNRNRHTCFGCTQLASLVWEVGRFESNDGAPAIDLSSPDQGTNCVGINGAPASSCGALPAKAMRWGQLKAMYR